MRRSTWALGLIFLAQVMSCVHAPYLVLRPALEVFTSCESWTEPSGDARSNLWCTSAGQGAWNPTEWLLLVTLAVLLIVVVVWVLPSALLVARAHDWRTRDDEDEPPLPVARQLR